MQPAGLVYRVYVDGDMMFQQYHGVPRRLQRESFGLFHDIVPLVALQDRLDLIHASHVVST